MVAHRRGSVRNSRTAQNLRKAFPMATVRKPSTPTVIRATTTNADADEDKENRDTSCDDFSCSSSSLGGAFFGGANEMD